MDDSCVAELQWFAAAYSVDICGTIEAYHSFDGRTASERLVNHAALRPLSHDASPNVQPGESNNCLQNLSYTSPFGRIRTITTPLQYPNQTAPSSQYPDLLGPGQAYLGNRMLERRHLLSSSLQVFHQADSEVHTQFFLCH